MRILVLQLARFGDIYQTWPTLKALRRKYPDAEIHFGVRERYMGAASGLDKSIKCIALPTKKILSPLIFSGDGIENSLVEMDKYIDGFSEYEEIINLSFSPFSSYLVQDIKSQDTIVRGYDRFEDGFLRIEDDASAYFYGQVGVGCFNRLHLVDLFAMIAEVELQPSDFSWGSSQKRTDKKYSIIHIGASKAHKTCSHEMWEKILRVLLKKTDQIIYLVGTHEEKIHSDWIETQNRVVDMCGKTSLQDLFPLVGGAEAVIAGDSMLVQIANLTSTKCINLSFPTVNFWETGPRAKGSRVLFYNSIDDVVPSEVCEELEALNSEKLTRSNAFLCDPEAHTLYKLSQPIGTEFQWALICAMYMGTDYPIAEKMEVVNAMSKIHELASLGIENLEALQKNPQNQVSMSILDEVDMLMNQVGQMSAYARPLVKWFLTEKSRIGPGSFEAVMEKTLDIFNQLQTVSNIYTLNSEVPVEMQRRDLAWK